MIKVILIFGQTAVNKSIISLNLAEGIGEIISADSMQIYKGLNIGTAKLCKEKRKLIPHYLIDIINPDDYYNAYKFKNDATNLIYKINKKGKIPFVVGGTALYIKALTEGLFEGPSRHKEFRKKLEQLSITNGNNFLYKKLCDIDKTAAKKINPSDKHRIIRALEVYELSNKLLSNFWQEHKKNKKTNNSSFNFLKIGITMDRTTLYEKINERCLFMLNNGFINEVKYLKRNGYNLNLPSMKAIGYQHFFRYLLGELDYDKALYQFKRDSRRLAKRQWTIFKHFKNVHWFESNQSNLIKKKIIDFIN